MTGVKNLMVPICLVVLLYVTACSVFDKEEFPRTYPDIGSYPELTVEQAGQMGLAVGKYNVVGYVVDICYCPPELPCLPCEYDVIVAADRGATIQSDPFVGFHMNEPRQLTLGGKYAFSIEMKEAQDSVNNLVRRWAMLLGYRDL